MRSKLTPRGEPRTTCGATPWSEPKPPEPFFGGAFYVFHQMSGPHTGLPQALINFHRVDDEADMLAYIARVGEVGRALGQALERAQLAAGEGCARAAVRRTTR